MSSRPDVGPGGREAAAIFLALALALAGRCAWRVRLLS
jgi:hypothetical protein